MRVVTARIAVALAVLALTATAAIAQQAPGRAVPDARTAGLARLATTLGLDVSGATQQGRRGNTLGIGSAHSAFISRLDSRSYVYGNDAYRKGGKIDVFAGSDDALVRISGRHAARLGIPVAEISTVKITPEFGQAGRVDPQTKAIRSEPRTLLNRFVVVSRTVDGLPVFSSYARFGLTKSGGVGSLRVHWPVIPGIERERARMLQARLRGGFKAPGMRGARPESVAAGYIHSPLFAEAMDVHAVIRVVYAPLDPRMSKKPVLYLDENGKPVARPRVFLKPPAEAPLPPRPHSSPSSNR